MVGLEVGEASSSVANGVGSWVGDSEGGIVSVGEGSCVGEDVMVGEDVLVIVAVGVEVKVGVKVGNLVGMILTGVVLRGITLVAVWVGVG